MSAQGALGSSLGIGSTLHRDRIYCEHFDLPEAPANRVPSPGGRGWLFGGLRPRACLAHYSAFLPEQRTRSGRCGHLPLTSKQLPSKGCWLPQPPCWGPWERGAVSRPAPTLKRSARLLRTCSSGACARASCLLEAACAATPHALKGASFAAPHWIRCAGNLGWLGPRSLLPERATRLNAASSPCYGGAAATGSCAAAEPGSHTDVRQH